MQDKLLFALFLIACSFPQHHPRYNVYLGRNKDGSIKEEVVECQSCRNMIDLANKTLSEFGEANGLGE